MELTFGLQLLTTRWGRPDVVICVTPPLLAAAMAGVRSRLTRRRPAMGILAQDLYSRGILETGAASGLTARAVRWVESLAMRMCDGVSVIHTGFIRDLTDDLRVTCGGFERSGTGRTSVPPTRRPLPHFAMHTAGAPMKW